MKLFSKKLNSKSIKILLLFGLILVIALAASVTTLSVLGEPKLVMEVTATEYIEVGESVRLGVTFYRSPSGRAVMGESEPMNATVLIYDNGGYIGSTTTAPFGHVGVGDFLWTPQTAGSHILTFKYNGEYGIFETEVDITVHWQSSGQTSPTDNPTDAVTDPRLNSTASPQPQTVFQPILDFMNWIKALFGLN